MRSSETLAAVVSMGPVINSNAVTSSIRLFIIVYIFCADPIMAIIEKISDHQFVGGQRPYQFIA